MGDSGQYVSPEICVHANNEFIIQYLTLTISSKQSVPLGIMEHSSELGLVVCYILKHFSPRFVAHTSPQAD